MESKELRQWRDLMGWSQEQAGAALDIGRRAYQEMENGSKTIDAGTEAQVGMFRAARQLTPPERAALMGTLASRYAMKMKTIDAMAKEMGRPRADPFLSAAIGLIESARKCKGHLINLHNAEQGSLRRQALLDLINHIDAAVLQKDAVDAAIEAKRVSSKTVVKKRIFT